MECLRCSPPRVWVCGWFCVLVLLVFLVCFGVVLVGDVYWGYSLLVIWLFVFGAFSLSVCVSCVVSGCCRVGWLWLFMWLFVVVLGLLERLCWCVCIVCAVGSIVFFW